MKSKKITVFLFFFLLLITSFSLIGIGLYFNKLSMPQTITGQIIDNCHLKLEKYWQEIKRDYIGDTFTLNSIITYNLTSEKYNEEKQTNIESLKKNNILLNLNQSQNQLEIKKNKKNKQAYVSWTKHIGQEEIVNAKYLIDNATKYYYVKSILNEYVNDGNSTYFETLSEENNSIDNIEYLSLIIKESLKENIKDSYYSTYKKEENIAGEQKSVYQVSIKLTDKEIKAILQGILKDLKKDERANKILTGIDEDFPNKKLSTEKKYLDKNESYTINIYTTPILYKPLKYEIIYLNEYDKKILSYEGDSSQGTFYYIEKDAVKYRIASQFTTTGTKLEIYNETDENVGSLVFDKNDQGNSLEYDFNNNEDKQHISFISKYENYKKNKSYTKHQNLLINIMKNKKSILNGEVKIESVMDNNASINEDISNAVLSSTLNEETKALFNNFNTSLKERLER